jgi:hypothetical protein
MATPNDTQSAETARVAVRLPPFWAEQSDVWFAQVEPHIGTRSCKLPPCSIVPQPTTLPVIIIIIETVLVIRNKFTLGGNGIERITAEVELDHMAICQFPRTTA